MTTLQHTFRYKQINPGVYTVSPLTGEAFGTVIKDEYGFWFLRAGDGPKLAGGKTRQEAAEFLAQIVEGRRRSASKEAAPEPRSVPAIPLAERRRRLEADIADAKATLNRAQAHFDGLFDELAALQREVREASR